MDFGLALTTATATNNPSRIRFFLPSYTPTSSSRTRYVSFLKRPGKFLVRASNDDPGADQWEQMELKFGRLIGEDPKLTLAKIMARKSNPDVSYLEVEKSFDKRKGKPVEIEEVPFDLSVERKSKSSLNGLNLVRPVPKKGVKFEADDKPIKTDVKKTSQSVRKPVDKMRGLLPSVILRKPAKLNEDDLGPQKSSQLRTKPNSLLEMGNGQPVRKPVDNTSDSLPNVVLRKPTTFNEDDIAPQISSPLRIKPNIQLKIGDKEIKDSFTDITLLKKPEPVSGNLNLDKRQESSAEATVKGVDNIEDNSQRKASISTEAANMIRLLSQSTQMASGSNIGDKQEFSYGRARSNSGDNFKVNSLEGVNLSAGDVNTAESNYSRSVESRTASLPRDSGLEEFSTAGLQPLGQSEIGSSGKKSASEMNLVDSGVKGFMDAALQGKPQKLGQHVKAKSSLSGRETAMLNPESYGNVLELENFLASSQIKEHEDIDWKRLEDLVKTGERGQVEVISSSARGYVVSFGSLIGFLPYRNVAPRWKFLAFESWLRRKGVNPSMYKHNLGIIGNNGIANTTSLDSSLGPEIDQNVDVDISPDMALEDHLRIYDQEKLKYLSSFVGQKLKVNVVLADRNSRRLIFSGKPKEAEESVEKKRNLMAKLTVGDVVKCCITKINYIGIFVEVEGVTALIHQTEVSWAATLDPGLYFKVGQIVEAKVHQLDFSLERIYLSLKEVTPDPLMESLDAVIGDRDSLDGRSDAAQANTEWTDVESLISELQKFEGIHSVSKGRFFLSPGLATTFQVYMASMFENEYKLLARSGKKVQELIVHTSLGKEEMKSAILTCTGRVE